YVLHPSSSTPTVDVTQSPSPTVSSDAIPTKPPRPSVSPSPVTISDVSQCVGFNTNLTDPIIENGTKSAKTVGQVLADLKAYCVPGLGMPEKPTDGKKVLLYHLGGCYGQSADQMNQYIQSHQANVDQLKSQYWVVELACNPNTLP